MSTKALLPTIAFFSIGLAQQDTLVDVFPLAVGNQWTYQYSVKLDDALNEICIKDSGTATTEITGRMDGTDSIQWSVSETRDYIRRRSILFCVPPFITDTIHESLAFYLVEDTGGRHRLYRNEHWYQIIASIIPFTLSHTDTSGIFRYRSVDSTGRVRILSSPSPPPPLIVQSFFTFQRGVGLTRYELTGSPATGAFYTIDHQLVSSLIVGIHGPRTETLPTGFHLFQNSPNPFNPSTRIVYRVPSRAFVELRVYDVLGREVATLVNEMKEPGTYEIQFDGNNLSSGVYFARMTSGLFRDVKKLLLLR